jgi:feruloyl esterase
VLAARSLIDGYYGKAPVRSIAEGCSGGGRATLIFAQRFPKLFDGYIVNAPAMDWSDLFLSNWVSAKAMFDKPSNWIPPSKYAALGTAVLAACDRLDGAVDGVLQDPRACHFDPSVLRCQAGDGPDCFTDDQIEVLKAITQRTRNKSGSVVARGWPFTGEEATPSFAGSSWGGWQSGVAPAPLDANGKPNPGTNQSASTLFGIGLARDFIFTEHPAGDYDWRTFDPDFDLGRLAEDAGLISAIDPNLGPMASRGAKMLFIGGWADQALPPQNWVDYVEAVGKRYGKRKTDDFLRLFMVPGMIHCSGGSVATERFDALGELEKWLDTKRAPDVIQAAHVDNNVVTRTRPLCAHPQQAAYIGGRGNESKFNVNDATFWHCATPAKRKGHGDDDDDD